MQQKICIIFLFRPLEKRTSLSIIDTLELARVYEEMTPPGVTCFTETMAYVDMVEKEVSNLKEKVSDITRQVTDLNKENAKLKENCITFILFIQFFMLPLLLTNPWETPRQSSFPPSPPPAAIPLHTQCQEG